MLKDTLNELYGGLVVLGGGDDARGTVGEGVADEVLAGFISVRRDSGRAPILVTLRAVVAWGEITRGVSGAPTAAEFIARAEAAAPIARSVDGGIDPKLSPMLGMIDAFGLKMTLMDLVTVSTLLRETV